MDILISKVRTSGNRLLLVPCPFLRAAWLTDAAYQHIHHNSDNRRLSVMLNTQNASHADLVYYSNFSNSIPDLANDDHITFETYQIFKSGHGLLTPAIGWPSQINTQRFKDSKKPTDYITVQCGTSDGLRQVVAERRCVDQILQNVWRLNTLAEMTVSFSNVDMNPPAQSIGQILARQSTPITTTNVIFSLQLLVESSKSFMFPNGAAMKTASCRIQALKFAGDVKKSVTRIRKSPTTAAVRCMSARIAIASRPSSPKV